MVANERDQLKAEVERLKGGQGEAVDALLLSDCVEHLHRSYGGGYFGAEVVQLFTSPPAPVAVMPDVDTLAQIIRQVDGDHSLGAGALAERIIDKVKELNQ